MAYLTGAATTKNQLLDTIQAFAESNGWTTNYAGADGANKRLHISKAGCYANFSTNWSTSTAVFGLNGSAGFTGSGSAWNTQTAPNSSIFQCDLTVGAYSVMPCTYHLFAQSSPDLLGGVLVGSNNTVTYFLIGNLTKMGAFSGGSFVAAANPLNSFGTVNTMQTVNQMNMLVSGAWVTPNAYSVVAGIDTGMNVSPLMPLRCFHYISDITAYVLRGYIPGARVVGRNYSNGDEITYGGDVWKVFYTSTPTASTMVAFKK